MARNIPDCPDVLPPLVSRTKTYRIHVITPLVGGGARAKENDEVTLIRVPGIRGQLRFWWRATRGASCEDAAELYRKEGKIWGTDKSPSPVRIAVREINACGVENYEEYKDPMAYALFPLEKDDKMANGISFNLEMSWPDGEIAKEDVESAIWAWVNFGGLGSRTRRGCGALYCGQFAPNVNTVEQFKEWYAKKLKEYAIDLPKTPRGWPTLPQEPPLLKINTDPMDFSQEEGKTDVPELCDAWYDAIDVLQKFRQGVKMGRNPGKSSRKPGRSRWPEADSIRRITGQGSWRHLRSITGMKNAFPRAEFGLPIVFPFKSDTEKIDLRYEASLNEGIITKGLSKELQLSKTASLQNEGESWIITDGAKCCRITRKFKRHEEYLEVEFLKEPDDCQLYPEGNERMASPLILKPLAIQQDRAYAMILLLVAPTVEKVELKQGNSNLHIAPYSIRDRALSSYPASPMGGRSAGGSALEAFMNFARENKNGFC